MSSVRLSDLIGKDIVNIQNGSRLGTVADSDLVIQAETGEIDAILESARTINNVRVITYRFDDLETEQMRNLADVIKTRLKEPMIVLLVSVDSGEGKVQMILSVSPEIAKQYPANRLIKDVARQVGGGGGGKPEMAQAGGKSPEGIDAAFAKLYEIIQG